MIKSSSSDCIFQFSKSFSAKAAMIKNWINPKKHVKEVRVSFAGYFFTTGACTKFLLHQSGHKIGDIEQVNFTNICLLTCKPCQLY